MEFEADGGFVKIGKELARESDKTRKAREKLRKKLALLDQKITTQALERKTIEIHRWISRHASNRVVLKAKDISLFDENKTPAKSSQKVAKIAEKLENGLMTSRSL